MKVAVAESLLKGHSYTKYRKIISDLLLEGRVTGDLQSEALLKYTRLNESRMDRLDKKMAVSEENIQKILSLKKEYIWLVLSEGWCGDAAQILPVLNKMAVLSHHIDLKIVFRDDNPLLMSQFLTDGGKSIPKLIVLDKLTNKVCASWGPRPKGAADLLSSYRRQYGKIDDTVKTELQLWYLHDKGLSTQEEILAILTKLESKM